MSTAVFETVRGDDLSMGSYEPQADRIRIKTNPQLCNTGMFPATPRVLTGPDTRTDPQ